MWFGFLAVFFIVSIIGLLAKAQIPIAFLILPVAMGIFGYFLMRALVFDLMDEVWDEGSSLLIKNGGIEERISLRNIKNISYTTFTNPNRVTLSLRVPGQFGSEVSFCPLASWIPFRKNKDIVDLIERVDKARTG
jgi:hypothetical protein